MQNIDEKRLSLIRRYPLEFIVACLCLCVMYLFVQYDNLNEYIRNTMDKTIQENTTVLRQVLSRN